MSAHLSIDTVFNATERGKIYIYIFSVFQEDFIDTFDYAWSFK